MDSLFFIASKLIGPLLRLETWIVLTLAMIVIALLRRKTRAALILSGLTFCVLTVLSVFPLGNLLLQPIERQYLANPPLQQVDGIIVLGGSEKTGPSAFWDQPQWNEGAERLIIAAQLARRFDRARILFSGGSGALRDLMGAALTEAELTGQALQALGIAKERLILEKAARNTAENAQLSRARANPAPGETWLLVTSAFHMPRALRSFKAAGWTDLVPYPVDYRTSAFSEEIGWQLLHNTHVLNTAIREWIGQRVYQLRQ